MCAEEHLLEREEGGKRGGKTSSVAGKCICHRLLSQGLVQLVSDSEGWAQVAGQVAGQVGLVWMEMSLLGDLCKWYHSGEANF